MKIFTMSEAVLSRRKTMKSNPNCQSCGVEIKVGDNVLTKINGGCGTTIRHEECARGVGLID